MTIPSIESARALARTVVLSLHNQDFHNLISDLSTPLSQHLQNFTPLCHSSLKNSLLFVDRAQSCPNISITQIEHLIHEHCTSETPFIKPPSVLACSSWDNTPVFLRRNQNGPQITLALIPIGRISPLDVWGVAILSEDQVQGAYMQMTTVWKYDRLMVIRESDLISPEKWSALDNNQGSDIKSPPEKPLCFNIPTNFNSQSLPPQQNADFEECLDSDDDYWGQYGDFEDTALKEPILTDKPQENTVFSDKNLTIEAEDENDDYWRKYLEEKEAKNDKDSQQTPSTAGYYSPSDAGTIDTQQAESMTRRVLATLDTVEIAPPAPAPNLGEVDPVMLIGLLKKLIDCGINDDNDFNRKKCFEYNDESHSDFEDIDEDIEISDRPVQESVSKVAQTQIWDKNDLSLSSSITSNGGDWASCEGSPSSSLSIDSMEFVLQETCYHHHRHHFSVSTATADMSVYCDSESSTSSASSINTVAYPDSSFEYEYSKIKQKDINYPFTSFTIVK